MFLLHALRYMHFVTCMALHVLQYMHCVTCIELHTLRYMHCAKYISSHALRYMHCAYMNCALNENFRPFERATLILERATFFSSTNLTSANSTSSKYQKFHHSTQLSCRLNRKICAFEKRNS